MSLYGRLSSKVFPRVHKLLEKELWNCATVLDLGCGRRSPLRKVSKSIYSEGVDLHAPTLTASQERKIHNKYHLMDVRKIDFPPCSFDCVMALDLIEHLPTEDASQLMEKMEHIAKQKVIIFVPNGFLPQGTVEENPLQAHLSSWTAREMRERGYRIKGLNGLKFLRKEGAALKYRPSFFWQFVSDLTQLWTYPTALLAFQLFCVKELDSGGQEGKSGRELKTLQKEAG